MQEYEQNMYVCMNPSSLIFKKRTTIEEMRGGLCEKRKQKYPKKHKCEATSNAPPDAVVIHSVSGYSCFAFAAHQNKQKII